MVPGSSTVAVMMNPNNPRADSDKTRIQAAAEKLGLRIAVVTARNSKEFEAALSSATQQGAGALDVDCQIFSLAVDVFRNGSGADPPASDRGDGVPELRISNAAAQTRIVSKARIRGPTNFRGSAGADAAGRRVPRLIRGDRLLFTMMFTPAVRGLATAPPSIERQKSLSHTRRRCSVCNSNGWTGRLTASW
jgi:hypothetical protein